MPNQKQPLQGTSRCNLTIDVIIEILSRLPASSLSRFKFVCKDWHSLISSDPHLAGLHFGRGFLSSSACPSIITSSYQHGKYCLTLMDADGGRQHRVFEIKELILISPGCNGLICINRYSGSYLELFNPTTLQKLEVPKASKMRCHYSRYFLGYVPTTREYKIVWLHDVRDLSRTVVHCEVLTLGTSSWRKVDTTLYPNNSGVTINGVMYWIVKPGKQEIMSFDLKEERFERIQFTRDIAKEAPWPLCLLYDTLPLQGRLCITVGHISSPVEVWMLEDPVNHAWIRKYKWRVGSGIPKLIIEGKFLVKSGNELWYCDIVTGARSRKIFSDERMSLIETQGHIESFAGIPVI